MSKQHFSFKKTGGPTNRLQSAAGQRAFVDIKLKGKKVGSIVPPSPHGEQAYRAKLAVKKEPTKADPCSFAWVTLAASFASDAQARNYLNEKCDQLIAQFTLHELKD